MKKIAQIVLLSTLLTSSVGITFAATFTPAATTVPSSQTTTDPNGTSTDTTQQPTIDPNSVQDPAAYNPAILHGPSTTTPTTDPVATNEASVPTDQPTRTDTTPTQTPDNPATTPTKPATTNVPPRQTPGRTTTIPPVVIVTPPIEIPVLEMPTCPTIDPLSTQNIECPTKETVSVMPQIPIALMGTSVLGLGLFWFIISYLNGAQTRGERRFTEKHLATAHRQHVNETKGQEYQNLLNHLTTELTTKGDFNVEAFQDISAKVQLLGSPEMQNLAARINESVTGNDRKSLKPLVKELVMQIKKEA